MTITISTVERRNRKYDYVKGVKPDTLYYIIIENIIRNSRPTEGHLKPGNILRTYKKMNSRI